MDSARRYAAIGALRPDGDEGLRAFAEGVAQSLAAGRPKLADAMQQSFVVEGRPKRLPSLPHISIAGGDSEPPGYETREV